jgi:hypothetical protein
MPKENGWTHVDPRYRIRRCRLYSRQSRRHQRLSCFASLLLSFSSRAVTKENPHQSTPLHAVVDNSTTVATIGRRGGTEYPYGTSELFPSFVNGSRRFACVNATVQELGPTPSPFHFLNHHDAFYTSTSLHRFFIYLILLLLNIFLRGAAVGT